MYRLLAVLSAIALLLTACSAPQPSETGSATPVPPPSAEQKTESADAPTPKASLNDRGNVVKKVGELAYLSDEDGNTVAKITLKKIQVDPKCTGEFIEKPKNGHFIALTLDVQTTKELANGPVSNIVVDQIAWKVISPDGTTENDTIGNGTSCMAEKDSAPGTVGPGEHVKGLVVLDSANTSGGLVLQSNLYTGTGWEWGF